MQLSKMTIRAFNDDARSVPDNDPPDYKMELAYNAEDYAESFELAYETEGRQAINVSSKATRYSYTEPSDRNFKFIFDSTIQKNSDGKDGIIYNDILKFKKLCLEETGGNGQPNYLILTWGEAVLFEFECRLKSLNIHYKLFNNEGKATRAEIEATFINDPSPKDSSQTNDVAPQVTGQDSLRSV